MVAHLAALEREADSGFVVTFRDLPEAVAQGDDLDQALEASMYSLAVALEFRIRDDRAQDLAQQLAIDLGRDPHDRTAEPDLDDPDRRGRGRGGRRIGRADHRHERQLRRRQREASLLGLMPPREQLL